MNRAMSLSPPTHISNLVAPILELLFTYLGLRELFWQVDLELRHGETVVSCLWDVVMGGRCLTEGKDTSSDSDT